MISLSTSTNILNFIRNQPYQIPPEEAIVACAKAGYRHLDCNICAYTRPGKKISPVSRDDWEESAHRWKKMADDLGVEFTQSHAFFTLKKPVTPDILPDGEYGEEMMRRSVLTSEILGVKWMVVHPVDVRTNGVGIESVNLEYNLNYYGKWNEFFKEHHVGMAIENLLKVGEHPDVWGDINLLLTLIRKINSENVGACLDTGHALISGYKPEDCIRQMGNILKATHIADNHGKADEHLVPYMGSIDWTEVVHALREIGYSNDFAFETHRFTGCFPAELQPELIRFTYTLGQHLLSL